jgi:hypothetical protein
MTGRARLVPSESQMLALFHVNRMAHREGTGPRRWRSDMASVGRSQGKRRQTNALNGLPAQLAAPSQYIESEIGQFQMTYSTKTLRRSSMITTICSAVPHYRMALVSYSWWHRSGELHSTLAYPITSSYRASPHPSSQQQPSPPPDQRWRGSSCPSVSTAG